MQNKFVKAVPAICLIGSMLLHLLLFMTFAVSLTLAPKREPVAPDVVSAYVDQSHKTVPKEAETGALDQPSLPQPKVETSKIGIEKPVEQTVPKPPSPRQALNSLKQLYDVSAPDSGDPVHMIGDKNKAVQPLLKLLGIALTHNLMYPKSAVDFNIRGTAVMGFVLYPDGHITNIQLIKSSNAGVLDEAAVAALAASSPLKNTSHYVSKPEYMVIGIIFG